MIVEIILSILILTAHSQKCDVSPIEISFDSVNKDPQPKLKFETNYKNLFGLPIDYEKELALLKLGYEGGQLIFTNPEGTQTQYRTDFIAFHLPAEHMIDGMQADMEMQIFHKTANGSPLVLSVFFTVAKANAFPEILKEMSFFQGQNAVEDFPLQDIMDAAGPLFYHYEGTETLNPCPKANWVLMTRFLPIHIDTLTQFIKISRRQERGNNKKTFPFSGKVYMGNNNFGMPRTPQQVLQDHSVMVNGLEEVYYNSPILSYINTERLNIYIVLITGPKTVSGSPDLDKIKADIDQRLKEAQSGLLFKEVSILNPMERALFDYIGLPED